jgi:hypothetical protein
LTTVSTLGRTLVAAGLLAALAANSHATEKIRLQISAICLECHQGGDAAGNLDLSQLPFDLADPAVREKWTRIHDRVRDGEMPPEGTDWPPSLRREWLGDLRPLIHQADVADVLSHGREPIRRLNRGEYEQNLRDLLTLPQLDVRDGLPEDRVSHLFNKTADSLDISRVQLTAYLEVAEAALLQAIASGEQPPAITKYRAVGAKLFPAKNTFGNRQAMFFAKENAALDDGQLDASPGDPQLELALFRSAHWPYYGYPNGFVARLPGQYRVRFSARAVVQQAGFKLEVAPGPTPMTFRARKPSGPDVSGDVRATGGLIDIQPTVAQYETTIRLRPGETFEYSLLGLPVPLARNVNNGPPTYRYPPFPAGGQPGVAYQWLEVEGPLSPPEWPPMSHRILFGDLPTRKADPAESTLPVVVESTEPDSDARRLFARFSERAIGHPMEAEQRATFEGLILSQLKNGRPFAEAMLTGYKAFLCSGHVLYLRSPSAPRVAPPASAGDEIAGDQFAIAARLSYMLTDSRPDDVLFQAARDQQLRAPENLRHQTRRLLAKPDFERFVKNFTDYWLDLRHIQRDEPNIKLYPDYRFDAYLIESLDRETRAFIQEMFRENLPISVLVDADFVFANDRLAQHYGLPAVVGSAMRRVALPERSPYGGLLTQGAILKVTSNGSSTSPVIRGAWVMERLLGQPPPPPPASVVGVEPDLRGATTIREMLSQHAKDKSCASCHARFDPIGLALENFDIMGRYRSHYRGVVVDGQRIEAAETDNDNETVKGIDRAGHDYAYKITRPIDASGRLLDGRSFRDIHELRAILREDPRPLARNMLQQLTTYGTGTPVRFSDRVEIEAILDKCGDRYGLTDLLLSLIESPIFIGR